MNDEIGQQTFRIPDDLPRPIRGIIANLRNLVDQFGTNSKEQVMELARGLDEEKICERNKISRLIKYILKDKIREGKITAKWIEGCLPEDYKRRYSKSEETSLSRKVKKLQGMLVDNRGNVHTELIPPNGSGKENQPMVQKEQTKEEVAEGCSRCLELEEALRKASKISTAEQLAASEIKVTISKDRYEEIKSAMQERGDLFYIIVDSVNRIFVRAGVDLKDDIIAD
jgi:hypothetical protein